MSAVTRRCAAGHDLAGADRPCRRCRRELVAARVAEADPSLAATDIAAAIEKVADSPAVWRELVRALASGPRALVAGAPPAVGRLVAELRARGSVLAEPTCVRCGRTDRPLQVSGEGGVCPNCRRRQLALACGGCGGVKPVAGRDEQAQPLCAACAPRPRRACSRCGKVDVVARRARGDNGDLCPRCYRGPVARCGLCARVKACNFVAEGRPICRSCSPRRRLACAHCHQNRPPCARWPEGPVCEPCYRAALARRGACQDCGAERRLVAPPGPAARRCADCAGVTGLARCRCCGIEERPYANGHCVRCSLIQRARHLIGDTEGPLAGVYHAIVTAPQPHSAHNWLRSGASAAILADVAAGALPLTHEALDAHP